MECIYESDKPIIGETAMIKHFISRLEKELSAHPNKAEIILEYKHHIECKLDDLFILGFDEEQAKANIINELGDPKQIAMQFYANKETKKPLILQLIFINYLLFFTGILITVGYFLNITLFGIIWDHLVEKKLFILNCYFIFWIVISFIAGKQYRFKNEWRMNNALFISLLPNFIFMALIIFIEKFQYWFAPFVNHSFLLLCIIITFLFYPVSKLSFKAGILRGI